MTVSVMGVWCLDIFKAVQSASGGCLIYFTSFHCRNLQSCCAKANSHVPVLLDVDSTGEV